MHLVEHPQMILITFEPTTIRLEVAMELREVFSKNRWPTAATHFGRHRNAEEMTEILHGITRVRSLQFGVT